MERRLVIDRGVHGDFKGGAVGLLLNHMANSLNLFRAVDGVENLGPSARLDGDGYSVAVSPTMSGTGWIVDVSADSEEVLDRIVGIVRMTSNLVHDIQVEEIPDGPKPS